MKVPALLHEDREAAAIDVLRCYFGLGDHSEPDHHVFPGRWFDEWDSTGGRARHANRFTADDLVAVSFLSVDVPATAARALLDTRADDFARLLGELGDDRDLVLETEPWSDDWAGWRLWGALRKLDGVGATVASKLYARKRPRLRPIYDSVVADVVESENVWEPLRAALKDDPDLHPRLVRLREEAGLPAAVSPLRVFDVVAWMEGKGNVPCPWLPAR